MFKWLQAVGKKRDMFIYISRLEVFYLRLLFFVRLGLQLLAFYQTIDHRYVINEAHSDIVMQLGCLAGNCIQCTSIQVYRRHQSWCKRAFFLPCLNSCWVLSIVLLSSRYTQAAPVFKGEPIFIALGTKLQAARSHRLANGAQKFHSPLERWYKPKSIIDEPLEGLFLFKITLNR